MSAQQDAAVDVAGSVARTTFESLPDTTVEVTKQDILDTLGVMVAGSTAAAAPEITHLARHQGGRPEASAIAFGDRFPAPTAAFVNGTTGHALDYDDTHDRAVLHVGPANVAAALATAQAVGGVDGRSLITAVAVGADLTIRLGLATSRPLHQSGFMFTPLYGHYGAAVASAKILGLEQEEVLHTLGIAHSQAAGNLQVNIGDEHALTKRLQIGFAARSGVTSALLGQAGLTGARESLEGRYGLFPLYQQGHYDRTQLVDGLGEDFRTAELAFKPYPCCRQIHAHVDAALQLRRDHGLAPDDIAAVRVYVNGDPHFLCDPLDLRRRPPEEVHAQFSIPYAVAVALTRGRLLVADFQQAALKDESVLVVADRVTPVHDPELPTRIIPPARMEIDTRDGRTLRSEVVRNAKGHPDNPMSLDELAEKFRDCAGHSVNPLPAGDVERAIELCADLENLADIEELVALLAPAPRG